MIADGRQDMIGIADDLRCQTPGGSHQDHVRLIALHRPLQPVVADRFGMLPGAGRHGDRFSSFASRHRLAGFLQAGADPDLGQGLAPFGVVIPPRPPGPVCHDATGQDPLVLQRGDHLKRPHPEGAGGPGDIVQVEVRDGGCDGRAVLIDDRVMNQGDVQLDA